MALTDKYSKKVHDAYQATQEKDGMTSANLKKLQKLLKDFPENKDLKVDGFYGEGTINAVKSFYDDYYWTPERKMQALKDKHGEKYIMQSEMEGMQETPPDTSGQGGY